MLWVIPKDHSVPTQQNTVLIVECMKASEQFADVSFGALQYKSTTDLVCFLNPPATDGPAVTLIRTNFHEPTSNSLGGHVGTACDV